MKKIILASALLLLGLTARSQEKVTEFEMAPALTVRMPLQGDSINQKGEKFGAAELLKTNIPLDFEGAGRISADTAGYITVDKPEADNLLYVFSTRMRAERFLKGKLKVTSPARFEVFVNGESKRAKTTAEDSLQQVQPVVIDLRLEPEADYEVAIKLLAASEDKAQPVLKCEWEANKDFSDIDCRISPDLKRRLSLYDTNFGRRVASVSLSPDGKYLLTQYSDYYDLKRARTHTELTEVKTGRVLLPNVHEGMRWMSKGSRLYYTVTGREGNDLLIYDPATGRLLLPTGAYHLGLDKEEKVLELRVITDRCSMEIYANGGLFNASIATVLDPAKTQVFPVYLDPSIAADFEIHKLKSMWEPQTADRSL